MTVTRGPRACFNGDRLEAIAGQARPWSPGRREDEMQMQQAADNPDRLWCMSEVDIFCDLNEEEMESMAQAAPMRTYPAGTLVFSPHQPVEALFILKKGRIRIFRVSEDGRALTTAIIEPGTIFGEMIAVGQQMHGSFAEAMDEVVVCVMSQADVRRLLLGDPRIAARITETMGRRLGELEQRLSDAVFKSVPERLAGTVATLAAGRSRLRGGQVRITHEQLAALAGTSRETTTKVLGDLADQGLIALGRGRITVLDIDGLRTIGGQTAARGADR
jgi:CRP/FNR family cyclic AMP-dependent transcriptional regulator